MTGQSGISSENAGNADNDGLPLHVQEYMAEQKYEEAQKLLEAFLAEKKSAPAAYNLGIIYGLQGKNAEAIHFFDYALI